MTLLTPNSDEASQLVGYRVTSTDLMERAAKDLLNLLQSKQSFLNLVFFRLFLLPNTAGCFTSKEAILTAELGREALETPWVKLEVIGDQKTLFSDCVELLKAVAHLVKEDFIVLPYCTDDLIVCEKLADIGCFAIVPFGAPIESGMGIRNSYKL